MTELANQDRRLIERLLRERKITREQLDSALAELPDLDDRLKALDADTVERFRENIEPERQNRLESIDRALARAAAPPPPPPVPVVEFDPDEI